MESSYYKMDKIK